jgi:hypothetical protein
LLDAIDLWDAAFAKKKVSVAEFATLLAICCKLPPAVVKDEEWRSSKKYRGKFSFACRANNDIRRCIQIIQDIP